MTVQVDPKVASIVYKWTEQGEWTYEDYTCLPDDGRRYEIIGGNLYVSPAPRTIHQIIVTKLAHALSAFTVSKNLGQVLVAPVDVILADLASPVQPDVLFITSEQRNIIKENFIEGVPNLIIEVLSPGNPQHDRRTKYELYEKAGVEEYWIVDPDNCTVDVYALYMEGTYLPHGHFERSGVIESKLFSELRIPLDDICQS
jgi:Uma2 family endonuclease